MHDTPPSPQKSGGRGIALYRALLALAVSLAALPTAAQDAEVDALQISVRELVSVQQRVSRTRRVWEDQRALLADQLRVLQARRDLLSQRVKQRDKTSAGGSSEATDRAREQQEAALSEAATAVAAAEATLRTWYDGLPEPFRRQPIEALRRVPSLGSQLAPGQLLPRCRALLDAYAAIQERARSVTSVRLLLTPPDRQEAQQFEVLLLGFVTAYAVSPDRQLAAVGCRNADGWSWRWDAGLASEIDHALAMVRGNSPAALVRLPIRLEETVQ